MRTLSHGEEPAPTIPDYELLRRIGQGSYGDVWLARGVTGLYRAIKVVWRARFADAAPFEREFKGLKEFAVISLGESIQLALLHIGRNDEAGFFYYVMELADDAERGRDIDPARYVPLTLTEVRRRRGRVPAADCVNYGVELARVLAGLHQRGLVHRDIKPSNVILVSGVAKVADIGLVTTATEARTYIGTEGFVPPEGPGTPAGDVFALGKLLYELSTGLDRQEFPRLPPDLDRMPDRRGFLALNEVVLRACEPDAKQRYPDGAAMLGDLLLLQASSPVRRWVMLGAAALVIAAVAAGLWWRSHYARPASSSEAAAPAVAAKSIAVLPFENLSDKKENGYLADGLQDDVVTDLAGVRELKVASRASAMRYRGTTKTLKQVGVELGVAFILTGSIRREGNQIRVTAQLIDARTDQQVWARKFDRELKDILAVQSAIAGEIVPALQLTLTPNEKAALAKDPTASVAAYDLYLQARDLVANHNDEDGYTERAEALLRQAVASDPGFTRAWVELATVHRERYAIDGSDPTEARIVMAEQAIEAARRLAPDAPEVLIGLGQIRHYCYRDYDGAAAIYRKVLDRYPNYPDAHLYLAYLYRRLGRWSDALAEAREASRLEPGNVGKAELCFSMLVFGRRYKETVPFQRQILKYWPDNPDAKFGVAFASFIREGRSEAALEHWLADIPAGARETPRVIAYRFRWAVGTGNESRLLDLIRRYGINAERIDAAALLLHRGERQLLLEQLDRLKPELDRRMKTAAQFADNWVFKAKYHALRGEKAEALAAIDRARQLLPEASDAINGPIQSAELTKALAWLGEKDAALSEIERLIKIPGAMHVWQLQCSIPWLPLRGDPRFDAIIKNPVNSAPLF